MFSSRIHFPNWILMQDVEKAKKNARHSEEAAPASAMGSRSLHVPQKLQAQSTEQPVGAGAPPTFLPTAYARTCQLLRCGPILC